MESIIGVVLQLHHPCFNMLLCFWRGADNRRGFSWEKMGLHDKVTGPESPKGLAIIGSPGDIWRDFQAVLLPRSKPIMNLYYVYSQFVATLDISNVNGQRSVCFQDILKIIPPKINKKCKRYHNSYDFDRF